MNKYYIYIIYTNTTIAKQWVNDKEVADLITNCSALSIGNIVRLATDQIAFLIPSTKILAWTSIPETFLQQSSLEHLSHQESPLEKETTPHIYNWNKYTQ